MMQPITFDLADLMPDVPADSIVSRTLLDDGHLKIILFGFDAGQELSEHTASMTAILHFLSGEASLTLDTEERTAKAGTWVHMPPRLPHSVKALTPVNMLLMMIRG